MDACRQLNWVLAGLNWVVGDVLGFEGVRDGLGVGVGREMAVVSNRGFLERPLRAIKPSLMDRIARTRFMLYGPGVMKVVKSCELLMFAVAV